MVLKYFIKENGKGAYCEGDPSEIIYDENSIDVTQRSSENYLWDIETSQWKENFDLKKADYINKANIELDRTNKFMCLDTPLDAQGQMDATAYRNSLRAFKNAASLQDLVWPECPLILQ